ncbi:hypothetical protein CI610_02457 [invertebrate metagenome]|uniref:VOC domain-containing protein n=1 Tax=invertebrate metagenome TaxID=1711999 RepID=A0A2H9T5X0_9ZZZZ
MKYHHCGIPTQNKLDDGTYLPHLKMTVSGYGRNAYGIEWMRFDEDADFPDIVKTLPHIAFEVDDINEAIAGKNVIISPNSPSAGVMVAFIEDNGAPIEFIQIDRTLAESGI